MKRSRFRWAVLLPAILLSLTCGYRAGLVAGGEGRRIAVPVFVNTTFRQELERDLTRMVRDQLLSRSRFRLVGEDENPDLLVRGRIVSIEENVITERSRGRIRETSVTMVVLLRVEGEGREASEPVRLVTRRAFVPIKGESIRTAEIAAMHRMAEQIVWSLDNDGW